MKNFLFILSPSLALYNQWRKILIEINSNGNNVDVFLPKPITYRNIIINLELIQDEIHIDKFLVLVNPLNPFSIKKLKLKEIKYLISKRSFKLQVNIRSFLARVFNKLRLEDFIFSFGDFIRYFSTFYFIRLIFKKIILKNNYDFLLYDLFEEKKLYIFPYLSYIYSLYRISLSHGNGISIMHFYNAPIWIPKDRLLLMDFTGLNKSLYNWSLKGKGINYKIIGIPNHSYDKDSLLKNEQKIRNKLKTELNLSDEINFITLTSRPDDNTYCNSFDRKSYLRTIGKFLSESKKWHLLIKAHPKEKAYFKKDWADALGLDEDSSYFSITEKYPLELASISQFGLCFVSNCCIDFACFGKPMIELRSIQKTKLGYKTPFFDNDGDPITAEAMNKLSFSVKSDFELDKFLSNLNNNIDDFSIDVKLAYQYCYGKNVYEPGMFMKIISKVSI